MNVSVTVRRPHADGHGTLVCMEDTLTGTGGFGSSGKSDRRGASLRPTSFTFFAFTGDDIVATFTAIFPREVMISDGVILETGRQMYSPMMHPWRPRTCRWAVLHAGDTKFGFNCLCKMFPLAICILQPRFVVCLSVGWWME